MQTIEKAILSFYTKMSEWVIHELPPLIILLAGLFISYKILHLILRKAKKTILKKMQSLPQDTDESEQRINTLFHVIEGTVSVIFCVIGGIWVLKKLGLDISPIMASAGIVGVALGFGAQAIVKDFLAGFFILLENQVSIGDIAIINGVEGEVVLLELRCTTLRDFQGVVHVFQNGKIDSLANCTKDWSAIVFEIEVAYKENIDNVMKVMNKVGKDLQSDPNFSDMIIQNLEVFGLDKFGNNGITIKSRIKTKPSKQWMVGREYRKRLKKAFDDLNIEIPFPQTVLHWAEKQNSKKK